MGSPDFGDMTCAKLTARLAADGATPVARASAVEGPASPLEGGHYIAMWLRPQSSCNFPHW